MKVFGIYGVSGFGREVMPLARASLAVQEQHGSYELIFIDDSKHTSVVNGHRVLSFREFMALKVSNKSVCVAIADSQVRQQLVKTCSSNGIGYFSIVAPTSLILDENEIGEGAIVCSYVNITSNATVGKHFHANIYSYVAHDCVIGDFVTFAPGVKCNGNVRVEDHAYIGTGAILKQGRPGVPLVIGERAVVGMGAVVTRNVEPGATVVGNPARPFEK